MKYIPLFVFLCCFSITGNSQQLSFVMDSIMDEYMKSGYANDHFMPSGKEDKNKQRQGKWKDYFVELDGQFVSEEGAPQPVNGYFLFYAEGTFKNDKRTGPWKIYVLEDKTFKRILQREVTFVDGEMNGPCTYFYPNGKVAMVTNYVNGSSEGQETWYYESGSKWAIRWYVNDTRNGLETYYYPNGALRSELPYVNDSLEGVEKAYYPNGTLKQQVTHLNGKLDGSYKYFHENGQLWIEKEHRQNTLWNVRAIYDAQGNELDKGTLVDGNGTVNYYTEKGEIYLTTTYENGEIVSENYHQEDPFQK